MKKFSVIIIVCVLFLCSFIYYVFHGLINTLLPFSDDIAKFIAIKYVNENIPTQVEQIGKVDKNIKDCLFEVDFFSVDNRDVFFSVYVDANNFKIYEDTYKETVFKNAIHNEMDIFFENLFGNGAAYDVFIKTSKLNDLNIVNSDINLSQINEYCESIDLYIYINYIENADCDVYDDYALNFVYNCSLSKLNIDKVILQYYSKSKIVPDLSYELNVNNYSQEGENIV